jgi:hypothetical protein
MNTEGWDLANMFVIFLRFVSENKEGVDKDVMQCFLSTFLARISYAFL